MHIRKLVLAALTAAAVVLAAPAWAAAPDEKAGDRGQDAAEAKRDNLQHSSNADDAAGEHPAAHSNPPVGRGGEPEPSTASIPPDPDDDSRGPDRGSGPDTADANAGCGNDADGTDDSEGLCGGPPETVVATTRGGDEAGESRVDRRRGGTTGGSDGPATPGVQGMTVKAGTPAADQPPEEAQAPGGTPIVGVGARYEAPRAIGLAALGLGLLVGAALLSTSASAALRRRRTAL